MKKIRVDFNGGESVHGNAFVNYMLAEIENAEGEKVRLYAEMEFTDDWEDDKYMFDRASYNNLRVEIRKQAAENGIDPEQLCFFRDADWATAESWRH